MASSSSSNVGGGDISSAEEDNRKRKEKRKSNWNKGLPKYDAIVKANEHTLLSASLSGSIPTDVVNEPIIQKLEDLKRIFPNLKSNILCMKAKGKKRVQDGTQEAMGIQLAEEWEIMDEWKREGLQQKAEALTQSDFYITGVLGPPLQQSQLMDHLRTGQLRLTLLTATYMQEECFVEYGDFTHKDLPPGVSRHFPPCERKQDCVGKTVAFQKDGSTTGFIFRSLMFPPELDLLLKENKTPPKRYCAACEIALFVDFVVNDRGLRMYETDSVVHNIETSSSSSSSSSSASSSSSSLDTYPIYGNKHKAPVYQKFRNPVDQEDGFFRSYMLCDPEAHDVFIDPIIRLNCSTVTLRKRGEGGCGYLDISALRWRRSLNEEASVGVKLSNF